jgi:dienelactone hydrolase
MIVHAIHETPVEIRAGEALLDGDLTVPENAAGLVVFAHGSGSSRHSSRNRQVARVLQNGGIGTLLMDLLTTREERLDSYSAEFRFNIELLARRLIGAADWLTGEPALQDLPLGYFGASTGAAAALVAASERPEMIQAIVSRGGRPDLAGPALRAVKAPVLLIVGGADTPVLRMNREAMAGLTVENRLEVIPGATHLFEEPGALERVAKLALDWFALYFRRSADGPGSTRRERS